MSLDPTLEETVWTAEPEARADVWNELVHGADDRDALELELADRREDYAPAPHDLELAFDDLASRASMRSAHPVRRMRT